jgi:hypothetical protein
VTLTGGLNYTDNKRYSTGVSSSDVFSGIDLTAMRSAPPMRAFRRRSCSRFRAAASGPDCRLPAPTPPHNSVVTGVSNQTAQLMALRALQSCRLS